MLHRRVWTPRGLSRTLEGTQAKRKKSQSQGRYCAGRVPGRALEATQTQWTVSTVSAEWTVWERASKISREISPFLSPHQVLRRMPPTRLRLLGAGDNRVMPFFFLKAIVTRLSPALCPLPLIFGPWLVLPA